MYEIKKQIEMSNIAIKTFYFNQNKYDEIADNLLLKSKQKEKLSNYIKILCMSSVVKNKELDEEVYVKIDKEFDNFTKQQSVEMCEMHVALLLTLELSVEKSKELKTDLRLKLLQELLNEIEINNRDLSKISNRIVTNIINKG